MKSLSSSRREVLVDCFHVYTYHISYLLPGSARTQHPAASLHNLSGHYPAASADTPLLSRNDSYHGVLEIKFNSELRLRKGYDMAICPR
ncbi:Uncharacterised protein [Klebsiella quasipneumoniae]|uniref:Uncharacterized protein n=1 Tax=Klebsiella quasipneumoniae TaxID=1463165 RepID=A0ABD7NBF7_9ENTR|nr:Uncharacterised protein [Klebsiella quasipneumoniae]